MLLSGCSACARAHYKASPGTQSCMPCPAGSFLNVTAAAACQPCPPNSSSTAGQEQCACDAGWFGFPLASPSAGTRGAGCVFCPVGSFKEMKGSHACVDCPSGSYSRNTAAAKCDTCPDAFSDPYDIALPQCRGDFFFACQVSCVCVRVCVRVCVCRCVCVGMREKGCVRVRVRVLVRV
jgi:hypothetical protein